MVENAGNLLVSRHGELIASVGGDPAVSFELLAAYPDERTIEQDDCLWQGTQVLADARRMEREGRYPGVLYGRVVPGERGRKWLQYWVWFYYNPKNLLGFGKHEGDWEMVQIELDAEGRPDVLTYAQHKHGEVRRATDRHVEWIERDGGRHPVVYVAALSHASYFESGTHPYFPGIDHAYGDGPEAWLPVEPFGAWNEWPGLWGSREHVIAGNVGMPPRSPSHQGKWKDPVAVQKKKSRRLQLLTRRLFHGPGRAFYPLAPELSARLEGRRCIVEYRFRQRPWRRSRHLLLTVHDGERVIASRTIRAAGDADTATFRLVEDPEDPRVAATTWNKARQRSDLTEVTPARTPT